VKGLVFVVALLAAADAAAYTVEGGDVLVRPVVGAGVNVLRLEAATRETPPGGMVAGLDFDWSFDGAWAFTARVAPTLSPGFVDGMLGAGVKYRVVQLDAPFIPYASLMAIGALGAPFGAGDVHVNGGGRAGFGADYFVMRDLAVGVEVGGEITGLFTPLLAPEATSEILLGVTWRL
jgi:hypothetical protein